MKRAEELPDGKVRLSTGTLYAALECAMDESLVVAGDPYVVAGRERRNYQLTPAGRAALEPEAGRLAKAARRGQRHLAMTRLNGGTFRLRAGDDEGRSDSTQ